MCVGWQVKLCDPKWRVMTRSSQMVSHVELYTPSHTTVISGSASLCKYCIRPSAICQTMNHNPNYKTTLNITVRQHAAFHTVIS